MGKLVKILKGSKELECKIGYLEHPTYTISIKYSIYKYENKFLWKKWYTYSYNISAPYINIKKDLQSVAERNTNIMIEQKVVEIRHDIEDKILQMKVEDQLKKV